MSKYVAFLDILGFKEILKKMSQAEAKEFISKFSSTIYKAWEQSNSIGINGYIVSDSFVIYTTDTTVKSLHNLLKIIEIIGQKEFSDNSVLLRGAIAKGEFDKLEAKELSTLSKGLMVGQAYVDAYLLEGTVKTIGIVLTQDVYDDISNSDYSKVNILEEDIYSKKNYVFRYLNLDFLIIENNLNAFIRLAEASKWLPHYYNAIYFALKNETNDKKTRQLFDNIINIIIDNKPSEKWREIDLYIKNAFNENVFPHFQTRILKYIRDNITK